MRALRADPRDQTSETDAPTYRVFFWSQLLPGPSSMWTSDEWELTDGDFEDALDWLRARREGRRASLWVVVRQGRHVLHVRLAGTDPTAPDDTWPAWTDPGWPSDTDAEPSG